MREHLLTRHFLQRFLDNDLISPDADRHEVLAVIGAALITAGPFVTVPLSLKYQFNPSTPARTALVALDDRFLFIAASMILMALVAVIQWDALALDARDTAILGPLPLPRGMIVRAKLAAVLLFAGGFALALNLSPSVLFPFGMSGLLPLGAARMLALIAAHAGITIAAGAFGFVSMLGLREVLRAVLGPVAFTRISTTVQASLVVFLTTAFLLLPGTYSGVAGSWLASGQMTPFAFPPLWFLGLHEMVAGQVLDGLPRNTDVVEWLVAAENEATAVYRGFGPLFRDLGGVAAGAFALVVVVSAAAVRWNGRRLPVPPAVRQSGRSRSGTILAGAGRFVVRTSEGQAGFFFTLQAIVRSSPHRLALATSVAVGLATSTVILRGVDIRRAVDVSSIPLSLLAVQTALIVAILAGFRHAVRVPAELRANWTFHLAWSGDERRYLTGVKRGAAIGLVVPTLLFLLFVHALVLGPRLAFAHLVCGLLFALVLLELLTLGLRKPPFAASYVPIDNLKAMGVLYLVLFWCITYAFAWFERNALSKANDMATLVGVLVALFVSVRVIDNRQRRTRTAVALDELPAPPTQRLELNE